MTSYVILGENAGPKKVEIIKKKNIPILDEDGFLNLIATRGGGQLDEKTKKKMKEEADKVKRVAQEMADKEKAEEKERKASIKEGGSAK